MLAPSVTEGNYGDTITVTTITHNYEITVTVHLIDSKSYEISALSP